MGVGADLAIGFAVGATAGGATARRRRGEVALGMGVFTAITLAVAGAIVRARREKGPLGDALTDAIQSASTQMQAEAAGYTLGEPVRTTAQAGQAARLAFRSGATESAKYAGNLKTLAARVGYDHWRKGRSIDQILSHARSALRNSSAPRAAEVVGNLLEEYRRFTGASSSSTPTSSRATTSTSVSPSSTSAWEAPATPSGWLERLQRWGPWIGVGAVGLGGLVLLWPRGGQHAA